MKVDPDARAARRSEIVRALRKYRRRVRRRLDAMQADLVEAERYAEQRRMGETLTAYFAQVPRYAASVTLPDPADPARSLVIALDPSLAPRDNAKRYFKRAAKSERAVREIPARLAEAEAELRALDALLEREARFDERAPRTDERVPVDEVDSVVEPERDPNLDRDLEQANAALPEGLRVESGPRTDLARGRGPFGSGGRPGPRALAQAVARGEARAPSARLVPRRFKTREGWDVLVGKTNEGNDYLTHMMARPEDYWFHVHGAAGSHVVLRRGKGKNEPSKATLQEVAEWTAFFSQARNAGKVPVIYTQKKYVRRPKKAPPGLAVCEREKTVLVRPREPSSEGGAP
jgi:predicted ribosome quality control (RQC) complex YloA/Tae2 family protein